MPFSHALQILNGEYDRAHDTLLRLQNADRGSRRAGDRAASQPAATVFEAVGPTLAAAV